MHGRSLPGPLRLHGGGLGPRPHGAVTGPEETPRLAGLFPALFDGMEEDRTATAW